VSQRGCVAAMWSGIESERERSRCLCRARVYGMLQRGLCRVCRCEVLRIRAMLRAGCEVLRVCCLLQSCRAALWMPLQGSRMRHAAERFVPVVQLRGTQKGGMLRM
jgi:hypothetical protein